MRKLIYLLSLTLLVGCSAGTPTQETAAPALPTSTPAAADETAPPATSEPPPTEPAPQAANRVTDFPDPGGSRWALVVEGLQNPLDLQHAGDERLFVVEQRGVIRVVEGGGLLEEPFLDIQDFVRADASERGLLGLAFHPAYAQTGRLFVNYTDRSGNTVNARFQVSEDPNRADPNSLRVVLRYEQPFANHNGGGVVFGPDGYLYIAAGDGGSAGDPRGNGQNLETLLGKLLRIDVDSADPYAIPPDNPYAQGGGRMEIWAYGLRNPWRFAFDPVLEDLFIGDVGQNQWEEIDFQPAGAPGGANYGWNLREGAHPFSAEATEGLIDPVAEYSHQQGCSVTGGVVVRDPSLPEWEGIYLYGDYCSGLVWGLLPDGEGGWRSQVLYDSGYAISSFGVDDEGRVYMVDHGGAVYRLERSP